MNENNVGAAVALLPPAEVRQYNCRTNLESGSHWSAAPLHKRFLTPFRTLVIWLLAPAVLLAQPPRSEGLSEKQQLQKRVRSMAHELVAGILDLQLTQLEENGLESLKLYGDIRTMRRHIDELIDAEMPEVVELLSRLHAAPADRREPVFVLARRKSREILVRLLVERQALLRRLRISEMAAQVKRLIELETAMLDTAESLPEKAPAQRESLALSAIEDQRDVKALYLGLKEMLREAGAWGGLVGVEAAAGLRLLETGRVGAEMDLVREHLGETRFDDAATSLRTVIEGLRALLESIERAQGLAGGDVDSAREMIRQLAGRQEQLREATRQPALDQASMDDLAQQQAEIRNQVAQMQEGLPPSSEAQGPLERAEEAAYEATTDLFEGRPEQAAAEQANVLENLAQAREQVQETPQSQAADMTADQYDRLIEDLEGAKEDLQEIRQKQETASATARSDPAEAKKQETQVSDMLAEVPADRRLPPEVTSRVAEAEEAAEEAAAQMDREEDGRRRAAERAEQAIERAASEVETALADARRHRLGAEIAELAQAARALDEAAAAERDIAQVSNTAAGAEGLDTQAAEELGRRQADVADVAANVAEGVEASVPEAAKSLSEAAEPLGEARKQLQAAAEQPGQPSKAPAAEASQQALQAAGKLAEAAGEIRREIERTAQELASLTGQQLDQATEARQTVETAIEDRPESIADRLQQLAEAERRVREAAANQQRAAGRPEAARAMELAAGIREVLNLQNQADLAAEALSERPNASPLEAIARQQDVAQAADQLAKQSAAEPPPDPSQEGQGQDEAPPDALAEAFQRAEEAAAEAAQDILDAKPDQAQAARTETREALEQAFDAATAEVKRAQEASPGEPDLAAQERVGEAATESQELAQPDAPKAAETLTEAGQTSEEAEQQVGQGNAEAAAEPQTATADLLEQAESQLAEAVDRLAQQAGEQLAEESRQAGNLTDQAIPVSPGATADLQSAESRAARAGGEVPELPRQAAPAEANIEAAMHEAVADLLAREQQLARDKALAERLAELATQEQEAADAVGQGTPPEPPSLSAPLADALAEAQRQLAQAQQATAEAARQAAPEGWSPSEPIQQAAALAAAIAQAAEPSRTSAPTPTGGGAMQQGEFAENQASQPAALNEADVPAEGADGTPDSHNQQAEDRRRRFLEEPWVLRLPAEMRAAIRAGSQRRPPRGYEERLERYFKNID